MTKPDLDALHTPLMAKALVIVESPAKAKTISKYLGEGYVVESSIGHIRDLPSTAAEIPAEYKNEDWARLGVNVEKDFEPLYIIPRGKKTQVTKLRQKLKGAEALYLATDEDREGEAIAWHLVELLKPKVPVRRMVFDEITKSAIQKAAQSTRDIDGKLVDAQEARRILDRLFGYEVSPVLWRKVKPKLSAGRVQSVATRLIVDRERERMRFVSAEYWGVDAELVPQSKSAVINARLTQLDGRRVALGKDFEDETGALKTTEGIVHLLESDATAVAAAIDKVPFVVSDVTEKPFTNRPHPPFITSTLQQEAGRKLRLSAQRTMRIAQSLYENGYITYMRTDSTTLSTQALDAARKQVAELYGDQFLPDQPRRYTRKSRNAQEAHEAIRPAGETFRTPKEVAGEIDADQLKLYELIWKRTVASQMKDAKGRRTTVKFNADAGERGTATFNASGKVIDFAGFLRAYVEGSDDPQADLEDQERILPPLRVGESLDAKKIVPAGHTTQPPARYTEASLVKELEERGIGRPSTYATIIQTIQDRGYVFKKGSALVPTFTAFAVINLLERHLSELVNYDFTARMEDSLDAIANGNRASRPWLKEFYFGGGKNGSHVTKIGLKQLVGSAGDDIDPRAVSTIELGKTPEGVSILARVGRYGAYVQEEGGELRASVPDDLPPDELTVEKAMEFLAEAAKGDKVLGNDPETNKPIYLKSGRFGPYVQLGDPELTDKGKVKRGGKPRMASLWPSMSMDTVTLDDALKVLSFPKELGTHPETGELITVQDGRFGPYMKMGTDSRSLANHEQMATITLQEAIEIYKQPKRGRGGAASQPILAELGEHPKSGDPLQVKSGRYGPYVTDGVVNASLPKGKDPKGLTVEEAVTLIEAREQRMRDQGKDPRAKKAKKASTAKKKKSPTRKKKSTRKKQSAA